MWAVCVCVCAHAPLRCSRDVDSQADAGGQKEEKGGFMGKWRGKKKSKETGQEQEANIAVVVLAVKATR